MVQTENRSEMKRPSEKYQHTDRYVIHVKFQTSGEIGFMSSAFPSAKIY